MNTPKLGLSALAVVSILFSAPAFAVAGKFQFVNGEVQVLDASGKARAVKKGDAIDQGETVSSGANGFAQIRMEDGGFFAVRPETEFKIDTFKYEGKEDGNEKGIFSLVKGSLRSVTGVVGKKNKDNYKINTATATIGIRGSGADVGHSSSIGTAVRTLFGGHSLTRGGKTINTSPGQTALVTPDGTVKYVNSFPFSTSTTGGGDSDGGGNTGGGNTGGGSPGGGNSASNDDDTVVIPIVDKDGNLNFTNLTQGGSAIGSAIAGPLGSGGSAIEFYFDDEWGWEYDNDFSVVGTFSEEGVYKFSSVVNGDGALIATKSESFYGDGDAYVFGLVLGSATATVEGRDNSLGVVWGRWSAGYTSSVVAVEGGNVVYAESSTSPYGLAFVTGAHITTESELAGFASWTGPGMQLDNPMPGVISGTYSLAPGNFPTLVNGVVSGSVTSALATVNFTNQAWAMQIDGSNSVFGNWQVSGVQGFGGGGGLHMSLSGSCSGGSSGACSGMGGIGGSADGGFVGNQAQGLISTFGVNSASDVLGGAIYLKRGTVANPLPVPENL